MKVPFRMPVELPGNTIVTYSFINIWRMCDGVKIIKRHELEISFDPSGLTTSERDDRFDAIRRANIEAVAEIRIVETDASYDDECTLGLRLDEELLDKDNGYAPLRSKEDEQKPIEWMK